MFGLNREKNLSIERRSLEINFLIKVLHRLVVTQIHQWQHSGYAASVNLTIRTYQVHLLIGIMDKIENNKL